MTRVSMRILAFAAFASLPLLAQQPSPSPQPPPGSSPQATPPPQTNPEPGASENSKPNATPNAAQGPGTANSPQLASPHLSPVTGELENKLDTKDAKTGDAVVMKTTEAATIGNGMEIPKGSEIKGHIVDVAAKGQNGDNARVTIQFDKAQLKNGQDVPIRSVIQSVAPPGTATEADAARGPAATTPGSGVTANGSAGTTGSRESGTPGTPSTSSPSGSSASGSAQATSPSSAPSSEAEAGSPPAPGTVVATRGNLAIKTTAIPGVLLIGDVNGRPFSNASGALLGAKQDVHLDGGTVMVVAIMSAPPTVGTK